MSNNKPTPPTTVRPPINKPVDLGLSLGVPKTMITKNTNTQPDVGKKDSK